MCDEACEEGHIHASYECPIFAKAFDNEANDNDEDPGKQHRKLPKIENMYAPCPLYTCITPLRILLRMKKAQDNKVEEVSYIRWENLALETPINTNTGETS